MLSFKNILISSGLILSNFGWAAEESLEVWDAYRDAMHARHVDGNEEAAQESLRRASRQLQNVNSEIGSLITKAYQEGEANAVTNLVGNFLSGKKSEIYCRGVGLVEMTGEHNDGTKSHLVLKDNKRELSDDFAKIQSGTWVYELSNGYRAAVDSTLSVVVSNEDDFSFKEQRNKKVRDDHGEYTMKRKKGKDGQFRWHMTSTSTTGEVYEPTTIFLAADFHAWGNRSLGMDIVFREGYTTEYLMTGLARSHGKNYDGDVSLRVGENLSQVETKDSQGAIRRYEDCYKVDYDIVLKQVKQR